MKTAILVFLLSAVLASEECVLRTQKAYNPSQIIQNEPVFANQFKGPFLQDNNAKVEATKEKLENYLPEIEASAETIDDVLIKISKLDEFFKNLLVPNRGKQNSDIVPAFKVVYDGKERLLNDDDRNKSISHNALEYELAHCSICTEFSQNPEIICVNKHSFCKPCLDHMHKSDAGIKCCPNCRDVFEGLGESGKSLTPELQVHLCIRKSLIESMSRAVIYFSFMALAYLLGFKTMGYAFQTYGAIMASFAPLPIFRLFRREHIKSVRATGDQKPMVAVVVAFLLTNFGLGIFTIGGWSTLFGFILLFPLAILSKLKISKTKDE